MNAIGFLALLYVIVCTLMWAGRGRYEQRHSRITPGWLRWLFVYAWWLVAVFHWYNLAMLRYHRRKTRIAFERFFGKTRGRQVMDLVDGVVRRP